MKPLSATDEKALLQQLQEGSERAFSILYRHYQPGLYLYAFKLTNDEDDAADIVQELFINLWNKRERLTFDTSFRAYLYRAVRHRFLNLAAHRKVRIEFSAGFQRYLHASENSTAQHIAEAELFAHIDALVAKLPTNMGRVFQLRNENLSDEAIASELNISEKTVRNLMSEAVKTLRAKLKYFVGLFFISL